MAAARRKGSRKRGDQKQQPRARGDAAPGGSEGILRGRGVLYLPLALTLTLLALSLLPRVQSSGRLILAFWGAAILLLLWQAVFFFRLKDAPRPLGVTTSLRAQHYIQALCQIAVFAYWGWYWRPVYEMAALILAQLVFAYAFDMLLAWSRREEYTLGFGPFPIIFSINLFLWFRDDWFYLQFLMIAVGFLGKELVRWDREGRSVHIFNPSAFSLGLFSLVLIATNTTDLTWGQEIASYLTYAPHIYAFLFAVGLVVMYFFSITLVAGLAAATLFGLSALYYAWAGVPYFLDSEIPAAVFLGLHLLITDPSTSPRTPGGKALFGVLYGVGVFGLYSLLGWVGAPTFYDKLLCVPLLNLSVRGIDALMRATRERNPIPALRLDWPRSRLNLAHMASWILFFGAMTATGRTDGRHTGDSLPFWQQACAEDRANACERLLQLEGTYCGNASAWACNELGIHYAEGSVVEADPELALRYFSRSCELRFQPACVNVLDPEPDRLARSTPRVLDLRLLLREGGRNLMDLPEQDLYTRACEHDWSFACGRTAGAE